MRRTPHAAAWSMFFAANACLAQTHCTRTETVAFSCAVGASKVVSLCLAKSHGGSAAQLSYRFGRLGAPDLVFPAREDGSLAHFRFAHYFRYQVDRTEIGFTNGGAEYAVFDDYDGEQKPDRSRGVWVAAGGKDHDFVCKGAVISRLAQLEPLLPCDVDSASSSCK